MLWLKALHIIFMVTWFAGLFYLPRLFVYHSMTTDAVGLDSIRAYVTSSRFENLRMPLVVDVTDSSWGIESADVIYCCNMIHIAPWQACAGLVAGAARILQPGGLLFFYEGWLLPCPSD